jgi:acyl-CoA dehydrogenase
MDFRPTDQQQAIADGVRQLCTRFDDAYWSACDTESRFPHEFHQAMAEGGWLGIAMPEAQGGSGLGITEAAIMMREVTAAGGGFSAASTIHMNVFGPHAIVVHGTEPQKSRFLPPLIAGR